MNFVWFKAEHPHNEHSLSSPLYLKEVLLMRDGDIIAELGDLKITRLPYCIYRIVPTGFRKIGYKIKNHTTRHIILSCGYLKSGEYIIQTPKGEALFSWNALSGLWTTDSAERTQIDAHTFVENHYTISRPHRVPHRHLSESDDTTSAMTQRRTQ